MLFQSNHQLQWIYHRMRSIPMVKWWKRKSRIVHPTTKIDFWIFFIKFFDFPKWVDDYHSHRLCFSHSSFDTTNMKQLQLLYNTMIVSYWCLQVPIGSIIARLYFVFWKAVENLCVINYQQWWTMVWRSSLHHYDHWSSIKNNDWQCWIFRVQHWLEIYRKKKPTKSIEICTEICLLIRLSSLHQKRFRWV